MKQVITLKKFFWHLCIIPEFLTHAQCFLMQSIFWILVLPEENI